MDLRVIERVYSDRDDNPTILLANIHCSTDIESNLVKMERIIQLAHEQGVNILIFPELTVTGYIWDAADTSEVRSYLVQADNQRLHPWLRNVRDSMRVNGQGLEYMFFSNVRGCPEGLFNTAFVVSPAVELETAEHVYDKIFLPHNEQYFFLPGTDRRLTVDTKWGRFGVMICYDLCFVELAREYAFRDHVDAIITMACWRSEATREYPSMNIKTDHYYGFLWNLMNSSKAAYNQVWSLGVNAVGTHDISEVIFWGGSGVWAPSGLPMLQASNMKEELLLMRHLDIKEQREKEKDEFDYRLEFDDFNRRMAQRSPEVAFLP